MFFFTYFKKRGLFLQFGVSDPDLFFFFSSFNGGLCFEVSEKTQEFQVCSEYAESRANVIAVFI